MVHILAASKSSGSPVPTLLFFVLLILAGYLLFIRPQRARARASQQMQSNIGPGTEVMTTAGLYGTVTSIDEAAGTVTVEAAPGVQLKFDRRAISRVIPPPVPETGELPPDDQPPP
jgi:preprotein translocase subunit YajC